MADWTPPPGHRTIPSPARAAELEAEVAFLTRQLSVRQSLEERLKGSESDKARLITKVYGGGGRSVCFWWELDKARLMTRGGLWLVMMVAVPGVSFFLWESDHH